MRPRKKIERIYTSGPIASSDKKQLAEIDARDELDALNRLEVVDEISTQNLAVAGRLINDYVKKARLAKKRIEELESEFKTDEADRVRQDIKTYAIEHADAIRTAVEILKRFSLPIPRI